MTALQWGIRMFACSALLCAGHALGQQVSLADLQAKLVGAWTVNFGAPPPRVLVINSVAPKADNAYLITGTFNIAGQREMPFSDGEAVPGPDGVQVKFTGSSTAVLTGTLRGDGSFEGISNFKGRDFKFRVEKGVAATAAVTEFDGKWAGRANPEVADCSPGSYDLSIKDGVISGVVVFQTNSGDKPSTVTGRVNANKSAMLMLRTQVASGRSSRVTGTFQGNEFKGDDPTVKGGRCAYSVSLKKEG